MAFFPLHGRELWRRAVRAVLPPGHSDGALAVCRIDMRQRSSALDAAPLEHTGVRRLHRLGKQMVDQRIGVLPLVVEFLLDQL